MTSPEQQEAFDARIAALKVKYAELSDIYQAAKAKGIPAQAFFHQGGHGGPPPMELMSESNESTVARRGSRLGPLPAAKYLSLA